MGWIRRVHQNRYAGDFGDHLSEQLQPFAADLASTDRQPGEISTRPGEAIHEPGLDRIDTSRQYDGNRRRRLLCRQRRLCAWHHDHVHVQPHQLGREVREPVSWSPRSSVFHRKVLSLDVAEFAQPVQEAVPNGILTRHGDGTGTQGTYPPDLPRRLRLGGEWR